MILRALCIEDMEPIRKWRNDCLDTLRTPFPLTKEQQEQWYRDEICNRNSRTRFWAAEENGELIGYGGLENIQWENSIGEMSLLIDPAQRGKGYGTDFANEIITKAFDELNLHTVYAECYSYNGAVDFWWDIFNFYGGTKVILPNRKFHDGEYFDGIYYSVSQ